MRQLGFDLPPATRLEARHFVIGAPNRDAHGWVGLWPEWPQGGLYLHGPEGSGKTHLARIWAARAHARLIPLEETGAAAASLPEGAAVLVEDLRPPFDETGLFHLCNTVKQQRGHLLLTGREPIAALGLALPDLRSRLLALPAAALDAPDDALLAAVLRKQFDDRGLHIGDEAVHYLLPRMERSFPAAARLVAEIDRAALAAGRAVTVPFLKTLLP